MWFAVEPVGVAVIGVLAALIIMAANRSARLRLLATGVLFGFGIQTVLLFAGYEFYVRSPDRAGPGGAVGILGGIVLLVAALIAAASRPASAAVTSGSVKWLMLASPEGKPRRGKRFVDARGRRGQAPPAFHHHGRLLRLDEGPEDAGAEHRAGAMLPHLLRWEREQLQAQLLVRILGFATEPRWHVPEPTPVAELNARWRDLEYVRWGWTNMGPAFEAVGEVLEPGRLETRALRPAILLVTDGLPTDPPGGFERGLAALTRHAAGRLSLRLAVAIGRDANSEPLDRFRSRDAPVLVAETIDVIVDRLVAASIAVSRMSEAGADRGALAQQLLQPEVVPGSGLDDDPIL